MPDRNFPYENIEKDGHRFSAYRIQCGKCEAKSYFAQTGSKRAPPTAAEQYFRRHGWNVGNGPRADTCPECQARAKPILKVVSNMEAPKAEQPKEMSRDERLIIMDKVRDVHDGEVYMSGWSDKKVATDLGVPWAWVKEIREKVLLFTNGSNEMYDDFLEKAEPVVGDLLRLLNEVNANVRKAQAYEARVKEIEVMVKQIKKEVGAA